MFEAVLVANRGEIACRIIATLRRLGIRSIAVYSDADAQACHVALADQAIRIGPSPAAESYLRIDSILAAAARAGAEAIHPGYGFLSENPAFARACAEAGIAFIGPPADVIEVMGAKDRAKALMAEAGVPLVPGYEGAAQDAAALADAAAALGFPVLLEGGGRRRWPGHAGGRERRRLCRCARRCPARGRSSVRRRSDAAGALSAAATPYRGPDLRRSPWRHGAPVRARLLGAAPPSKSDRGGAGTGVDA